MDHGHVTPHSGALTLRLSIILYASSYLFYLFQSLSADLIWTWVWRGLSLISLLLIIYINWNKAGDILKNKKKSKSSENKG